MKNKLHVAFLGAIAVAVLGGCGPSTTPVVGGPAAPVASSTADPRMVTYPTGRYQLIGDGSAASPYYWVWVPTGASAVPAPPIPVPAVPATVIVPTAPERVVAHQQGQYKLYGDGSTVNPYYLVWVPAGQNPPAPPRLPQLR
jgi:hypothetical protein